MSRGYVYPNLKESARIKPAIIAGWFRDYAEELEAFLETFDESDRLFARAHVLCEIQPRAELVAQHQSLGRPSRLVWAIGDWDLVRRRVLSQRRAKAQADRVREFGRWQIDGREPAPEMSRTDSPEPVAPSAPEVAPAPSTVADFSNPNA